MRRIISIMIGGAIVFAVIKMFFDVDDKPGATESFRPKDERFAVIEKETVKPDLLGRYPKKDITLPTDIKPSEVERVIRVWAKDSLITDRRESPRKPIDIIIDRQGRIFIENKFVDSVKEFRFEKPWIAFEPSVGLGVGYSARGAQPSIAASLFYTKGFKWPSVEAGLYGFGVGCQRRITGRLHAGLYAEAAYKNLNQRSLKLNLTLNL